MNEWMNECSFHRWSVLWKRLGRVEERWPPLSDLIPATHNTNTNLDSSVKINVQQHLCVNSNKIEEISVRETARLSYEPSQNWRTLCGVRTWHFYWQALVDQVRTRLSEPKIQKCPTFLLLKIANDTYLASSARSCLAAFTMLVKAGTTSAYFLVFRPQSGLIHSTLDSSTASICTIHLLVFQWEDRKVYVAQGTTFNRGDLT